LKYTQNYNLKKPEGTDLVNIDDLNYNADVIDTELAKRIINAGNVPSIQAGLDASKPAPGTAGRLFIATDTQIIYCDIGSAWQKIGVVNWNDISGKPSSFPPSAHKHVIADITDINTANVDKVDGYDASDFALATLNPNILRIKRSNPDAYGNYLQVDYYRKDGTLFARSVLSGGTPPQYTTRTITIYDADGTTVVDSYTFSITYDANGNPVNEW